MSNDLRKVVEYVGGEPVVKFMKGDWNEEDHPRDENGKFAGTGTMKESFTTFRSSEHFREEAVARGWTVRAGTHPSGEDIPYLTATDKEGNFRGEFSGERRRDRG